MAQNTTLILVWLAGDSPTRSAIDPLLKEVQTGLDEWNSPHPLPDVFCFYHHWDSPGAVATHSFRIGSRTLRFKDEDGWLDGLPDGAVELHGDIPGQLMQFVTGLTALRSTEGPIRIIFASHGVPGLGFSPESQFLENFRRFLLELFPEFEDRLILRELPRLNTAFIPMGTPPGGFTAAVGRTEADLTLDEANSALAQLPGDRVRTLFLHNCTMSSVEVISALRLVPHHIACETTLGGLVPLSKWFATLGDPAATEDHLTRACFDNLPRQAGRFDGRLSSHRTDGIVPVLERLDALGDGLCLLMDANGNRSVANVVLQAWDLSQITIHTVDISEFCTKLASMLPVLADLLSEFTSAVMLLQLDRSFHTSPSGWQVNFKGINFFLPRPGSRGPLSSDLPATFQAGAPRWCEFLDRCSTGR